MELTLSKELSIQISLSGLSFCILDRETATIDYLKHFAFAAPRNPHTLLEELKAILDHHYALTQDFKKVLVLFQNELVTLVPEAYFKEEKASDYLKFGTKIISNDFMAFDRVSVNKSVNVYVPYVNINNYLFEVYGAFEYKHAATVLLETVLGKETSGDGIYLNVSLGQFQILVLQEGVLHLINTFSFETAEDFLYYVLFVIEQLKLDPEVVKVNLMGHIEEEDTCYQLLYEYVRNVGFYDPSTEHLSVAHGDMKLDYRSALLLNSF